MARDAPPAPVREVRPAYDLSAATSLRILCVGPTGSGKTAQIWTLPGKKFVFAFDPNTPATLAGCPDTDVVEFYPEFLNVETALKGFNVDPSTKKKFKGDKSAEPKEPRLYEDWRSWFNDFVASERIRQYEWIIFDSLTFLAKAMMDRQLFINNRYGDIEDLGDYRVVGTKLADIFGSITGLGINTYCTGHLQVYEDEKTKKIVTQIMLPGKGRSMLPLSHTEVWEIGTGDKAGTYEIKTVADRRGLQEIRTSLRGLAATEDVTIKSFSRATDYGVGALIKRSRNAVHNRSA